MINENDIDGNGIIDFDEFVGMMEKRLKTSDPHEDYEHAYMVPHIVFELLSLLRKSTSLNLMYGML